MWTLDDALKVIREAQPIIKEFNYHLALAGSVLNNGFSNNDLDIVALPLNIENVTPDEAGLLKYFADKNGEYKDITDTDEEGYVIVGHKLFQFKSPTPIDLFVFPGVGQ